MDGACELLGTDVGFVETAKRDLGVYVMLHTRGTRTPAFKDITIPPMVGLGGRVAVLRRPIAVYDYYTEQSITRDFVDIVVHQEGLRGMACVPVRTTLGIEALLYVAMREPGLLGDRALDTLIEVAAFAGIAIDQASGQAQQRELSVLRERQRIASALHASVAQTLFAIGVEAKRAREDNDQDRLTEAMSEIVTLASKASEELRNTLHHINETPARMSLAVALDAEARAFEQLDDVAVRVVTVGQERPLADVHQTLICDTVHEGVRNAVKHGGAQLVVVHVRYGDDDVRLTVQSGHAVVQEPGAELRPRGGLLLLAVRARALRGDLELLLGEEGEAIVRLRLPYYRTGAKLSAP